MIANLSTLCKVQLNEFGKEIWMSQINELPDEVLKAQPEIIDAVRSRIDKDGCVELELWGIMNLFGPHLGPTTCPFVSNVIELQKNPNFGKFFKQEAPTHEN